jgi:atypical dual specificity phosphatase
MQYHKMMTPGHNQIPNEACYQQFANVVRNFLEANKNNGKTIKKKNETLFFKFYFTEKLIGVHCTHGLNRTGYLIVR